MSKYEDEYVCPRCHKPIDLDKTKIDVLLRKFSINETLVKSQKRTEELEKDNEQLKCTMRKLLIEMATYECKEFKIQQLKSNAYHMCRE